MVPSGRVRAIPATVRHRRKPHPQPPAVGDVRGPPTEPRAVPVPRTRTAADPGRTEPIRAHRRSAPHAPAPHVRALLGRVSRSVTTPARRRRSRGATALRGTGDQGLGEQRTAPPVQWSTRCVRSLVPPGRTVAGGDFTHGQCSQHAGRRWTHRGARGARNGRVWRTDRAPGRRPPGRSDWRQLSVPATEPPFGRLPRPWA